MIQKRYSWTDEYVLDTLPAERVMDLFNIIGNAKERERKEEMQLVAFGQWLKGRTEMSFADYLMELKLHSDEASQADQHVTAEEALEHGKNILKMLG